MLTGIHLASYGRDIGSNLITLLSRIEDEKILNRIRLSSLDPADITDEFIDFINYSQTICPSFHIALQSGDQTILKNMRRRYKPERFLEITDKIRETLPESAIGTDIMAGFPGETEKEFNNSYDLLHKSSLTYFHVFPYSKRQGTIAARMDNQIKPEITKERSKILRDLGNKKKLNFYNKFIGKKLEILVEKDFKGTSRNYIPVFIRENNVFRGQIIDAVVTEVNENSVVCNTISHL